LVASQLPVRLLVLLAGMIPAPGERPGEWWSNTGYRQAVEELRRVAQERLGAIPDEVPGCHCAALSHPKALSELLASYLD
jgi:hypothetical protein